MLATHVLYRLLLKDRVFLTLLSLSVVTFLIGVVIRHPSFETTPLPFELSLFFVVINIVFAFASLRREPLLGYMFLTVAILNNIILIFFFRYLLLIQAS